MYFETRYIHFTFLYKQLIDNTCYTKDYTIKFLCVFSVRKLKIWWTRNLEKQLFDNNYNRDEFSSNSTIAENIRKTKY